MSNVSRGHRRSALLAAPIVAGIFVVGCLFPSLADLTGGGGAGDGGGSDGSAGDGMVADASDGGGAGEGGATSCNAGANGACGIGGTMSCCASVLVPGGTYNRSNDVSAPATVSSFSLDVYEVTVGRFRAFVDAGKGTQVSPPSSGDGGNPRIPNSGWPVAYDVRLTTDSVALKAALRCDPAYPAWNDVPNGNETRPMNCLTYYEAFAFCAWDGGRLPTEAEWNYAAAGGSEGRPYPWGDAGPDQKRACYDCACDGSDAGQCAFSDLLTVGSLSPLGDGKWGQSDLAGNVWEWTLDLYASTYPNPCTDCANLTVGTDRVTRGGAFDSTQPALATGNHADHLPPAMRFNVVGARCAR